MNKKTKLCLVVGSLLCGLSVAGCDDNTSNEISNGEEPSTTPSVVTSTQPSIEPSVTLPSEEVSTKPSEEPSISTSATVIPTDAVEFGYTADASSAPEGWSYFNNPEWWEGTHANINAAYVHNDETVFSYEYDPNCTGTISWGCQLFYQSASVTKGQSYRLTFKLNSTGSGEIIINGKNVNVVEGENKIELELVAGSDGYNNISSMTIQFPISFGGGRAALVFSEMNWEKLVGKLPAPVGIVIGDAAEGKTIAFANVDNAVSYVAVYVDASTNETVDSEPVTNGGVLTKASSLPDGTYKVFVKAIGDDVNFRDSDLSSQSGVIVIGEIVTPDPEVRREIVYGEDSNMPLNEFVYWNDQWWCGSGVTVNEAYLLNNEAVFDYSYLPNSNCTFGFQIFYKNALLTAGTKYKLSLNINSSKAGLIKVNGEENVALIEGDNEIQVTYVEGQTSISIQVGSDFGDAVLKLSNWSWTKADGSSVNPEKPNPNPDTEDPVDPSEIKEFKVVAQGNQKTKIEGAGAWIYFDNSEMNINATTNVKIEATVRCETTNAAFENYATGGAAEIKINSTRIDDYGPTTARVYVELSAGLPSGIDFTHEFTIRLIIGDVAYDGIVTFKGNFYVDPNAEPEEEIEVTETKVLNFIDTSKIEGAGAWIYFDNSEIGINGETRVKVEVNVSCSTEDDAWVNYADNGPAAIITTGNSVDSITAESARIYVNLSAGLPDGLEFTHTFTVRLIVSSIAYEGTITFVGNAFVA